MYFWANIAVYSISFSEFFLLIIFSFFHFFHLHSFFFFYDYCDFSGGYSVAQQSTPQQLAPPEQKPSEPIDVYMTSHTSSSLSILWTAGHSNGGSAVGKYKIEWDVDATFNSYLGAPMGSHHKVITNGQNCSINSCSYIISGLQKGQAYYARVFAYNSYGYSQRAGIPVSVYESPKTQPNAPAGVFLQGVDSNSIQVIIQPPSDNGGAVVSRYNIEWDVLDASAYDSSTKPALSLLYSKYDVQSIQTSDSQYGLSGYFYVSFNGMSSGKIAVDSTADDMLMALQSIPTVGNVLVTREEQSDTFGYLWTITFLDSEYWNGKNCHTTSCCFDCCHDYCCYGCSII